MKTSPFSAGKTIFSCQIIPARHFQGICRLGSGRRSSLEHDMQEDNVGVLKTEE